MTGEAATLRVIDVLEALAIPYMITGSFASNVYGVPRATGDADFVVQLVDVSVRAIADALGDAFRLDPQMSFEAVTMTTRHVLQVAGTPFKIELFHLSDDAHDRERFQRRRRTSLSSRQPWLISPEDSIITKLRWVSREKRSKDWDDIRDVVAVQGERIDWGYVYSWCDRHGTRSVLDEIRASIPPINERPP
ncbi:MAG TPA: hypothetical protein VGY58_02020 [Gemmataceae bacterium]|jgi:hypothetical protein|nr:hypothetical protein [Gemmataceae bacterium]